MICYGRNGTSTYGWTLPILRQKWLFYEKCYKFFLSLWMQNCPEPPDSQGVEGTYSSRMQYNHDILSRTDPSKSLQMMED